MKPDENNTSVTCGRRLEVGGKRRSRRSDRRLRFCAFRMTVARRSTTSEQS